MNQTFGNRSFDRPKCFVANLRGNFVSYIFYRFSLQNLLGESPERFDSWPSLSRSVNGHVLVLEVCYLM